MRADKVKQYRRQRRKRGIRKKIFGTADRPRVTVFRSLKHTYAQVIDDQRGVTLCAAGTRDRDLRDKVRYGGNVEAAKIVGAALAQRAKEKGIERICFDRNGYRYGGRVRAIAEALRESGISF